MPCFFVRRRELAASTCARSAHEIGGEAGFLRRPHKLHILRHCLKGSALLIPSRLLSPNHNRCAGLRFGLRRKISKILHLFWSAFDLLCKSPACGGSYLKAGKTRQRGSSAKTRSLHYASELFRPCGFSGQARRRRIY